MAEGAKKLGDGVHQAEVVGTPTPLQRKMEELLGMEASKPVRRRSERPAVMRVLKGESESAESSFSPELLARAYEVLDQLKGMNEEEQAEYREQLSQQEPEVISALPLAYELHSQQSRVRIREHFQRADDIMTANRFANQLLDQATEELTEEVLEKLGHTKKASGE